MDILVKIIIFMQMVKNNVQLLMISSIKKKDLKLLPTLYKFFYRQDKVEAKLKNKYSDNSSDRWMV